MIGKLLDRLTVVDGRGNEFDIGELTTYLNDAVLLAPSMLLGLATTWTGIDDHTFDVKLSDAGRTVTGRVFLDGRGAPRDFSAYLRSASGLLVRSPEAQVELARRIEEAERDLLGVLLLSPEAARYVAVIDRKLEEGELSPWDVVIGARPDGEDAKRRAHDELRRALGEISRLDALCEERRRELRSDQPTSEERAAQLRQGLEASGSGWPSPSPGPVWPPSTCKA